jgi:hypothetical protein
VRQRSFIESGVRIVRKLPLTFVTVFSVAVVSIGGCGKASVPSDAQQAAAVLSGDSNAAASDNPMCRLFSADELAAYSGVKLGSGANAAMGSGCQWETADGRGLAMIQIIPLDYAIQPNKHAPGYRAAPEVGEGGYVNAEAGGWTAGASSDKEFVVVQLNGPKASVATAIALLAETMRRRR